MFSKWLKTPKNDEITISSKCFKQNIFTFKSLHCTNIHLKSWGLIISWCHKIAPQNKPLILLKLCGWIYNCFTHITAEKLLSLNFPLNHSINNSSQAVRSVSIEIVWSAASTQNFPKNYRINNKLRVRNCWYGHEEAAGGYYLPFVRSALESELNDWKNLLRMKVFPQFFPSSGFDQKKSNFHYFHKQKKLSPPKNRKSQFCGEYNCFSQLHKQSPQKCLPPAGREILLIDVKSLGFVPMITTAYEAFLIE